MTLVNIQLYYEKYPFKLKKRITKTVDKLHLKLIEYYILMGDLLLDRFLKQKCMILLYTLGIFKTSKIRAHIKVYGKLIE